MNSASNREECLVLVYYKLSSGKVKMFCPKCGTDAQNAKSYCTRCGDWLPDLNSFTCGGLFRKRTHVEKIRKIRVLGAVSAGLAITTVAMCFAVLRGAADKQLLFLSLFCCLTVAVYQVVNFYLGHTLQRKSRKVGGNKKRYQTTELERLDVASQPPSLFCPNIVENTTKHQFRINVKRQE